MADSKDVNALLRSIRAYRRQEAQLKKQKRLIKDLRTKECSELSALIKGGVTTGDPVSDYIYARWGEPEPVQEREYRRINRHLFGKTGELVAAFSLEHVRMHGPRDETRHEVRFHLAVLRDDKLQFTQGETPSCTLPVTSYAVCNDPFDGIQYKIVQEPIKERLAERFEVLKKPKSGMERPSERYRVGIVAGTEEVRALTRYKYQILRPQEKARIHQMEQELGFFELEGSIIE